MTDQQVAAPPLEKTLQIELAGTEPIPAAERHGKPRTLFTLWFGANVQFATLSVGALSTSVFGLDLGLAAIAVTLGTLLSGCLIGLLSVRGARAGVPQLIQSRFGYRMIHTLERVLGALLLAVFVVVSFYGFGHAASGPAIGPFAGTFGAFVLTVSVTSARGLGWAMYSSDYSRYLPADTSAWRIFGAATGGTVAAGAWIGVLGAALGTVAAVSDPTTLVSQQLPHTLGTITLIFLLGSTLASTVLDLYSGAMAALVAGIAIPRWVSVVVVTGCGTIAAWLAGQTDFASSFQNFLLLMSYWLAPWTAVTLVALFWRHRGRVDLALLYDRTHKFGRGLPAVLLGVLAAVPFMNQSLYTGPLASAHPALGGIGHMVGFAVAGLAYALMTASSARAAR